MELEANGKNRVGRKINNEDVFEKIKEDRTILRVIAHRRKGVGLQMLWKSGVLATVWERRMDEEKNTGRKILKPGIDVNRDVGNVWNLPYGRIHITQTSASAKNAYK